jgi:hypothetical protein
MPSMPSVVRGGEVWIAAGFGLMHGLAFATLLGGLDVGTESLVTSRRRDVSPEPEQRLLWHYVQIGQKPQTCSRTTRLRTSLISASALLRIRTCEVTRLSFARQPAMSGDR